MGGMQKFIHHSHVVFHFLAPSTCVFLAWHAMMKTNKVNRHLKGLANIFSSILRLHQIAAFKH